MIDLVDQFQDHVLFGRSDTKGRSNEVPPLYQRVLSALIVEDDAEEFEEDCGGRDISFRYSRDDSPSQPCLHNDAESRRDTMEFDYGSTLGINIQRQHNLQRSFCNGNSTFGREPNMESPLCNDDFSQGDRGCINSEFGLFPEFIQNDLAGSQSVHMILPCVSEYNSQYEQLHMEDRLLLELQNIGLYPEAVVG